MQTHITQIIISHMIKAVNTFPLTIVRSKAPHFSIEFINIYEMHQLSIIFYLYLYY